MLVRYFQAGTRREYPRALIHREKRGSFRHSAATALSADHRPGLLANLALAAAHRARRLAVRLTGQGWPPARCDPARSGLGRALHRSRRSLP